MILASLEVAPNEFQRATGWQIKPEGACREDRCIPLPDHARRGDLLDVTVIAERLSMPLVRDEAHNLWALGPESGARALSSAVAPDLVLPTWRGQEFRLSGLRGLKVLLLCWASW